MNDKYHRAARDGFLSLLKEANRKELNMPDEDGLTPVLWAAHHGKLEALRVMLGRGGDPDRCDIWGNTPLHLAAANGHLNCLSFLVSFGANVWCLDNDYHTPLDAAAVHGHMASVRYLDSVAAKQSALNPKLVRKLKERAFHNAEQRAKRYAELQHQHQRRMEKQFLRETMESGATVSKSFSRYRSSVRHKIPQFSSVESSITYTQAMLNSTSKSRTKIQKHLEKKKPSDSTFKISEGGRRSVRSLSGLQMGNDVMFLKQGTCSGHRQRIHVRNMFPQNLNDDDADSDVDSVSDAVSDLGLYTSMFSNSRRDSLFSRPGLGTMIFRRSYTNDGLSGFDSESLAGSDTLGKLLTTNVQSRGRVRPRLPSFDQESTCSTAGLPEENSQDLLCDDTFDCDDEENLQSSSSPLEVFLESHGLGELHSLFLKERMDLDALVLCSEADLAVLDVPLSPRKKLLEACSRRTHTLRRFRAMLDTHL
ncbi:pre-mRNA splicing regulator USH1G [Trichomycterus rosablanca]|uniref:pre-mRNA splicing regulator USH1G n=1 Tax=Trichomycterus rosablanca TaxID=2290929 RepID=UPI002F354D6F